VKSKLYVVGSIPIARSKRDAWQGWRYGGTTMDQRSVRRGGWSWWYLLFVVQFAAVIWPPLYNKVEPSWIGMPFFYWYQLLWVIIGAILTAIVYFATED
jgi:hypothetical protein